MKIPRKILEKISGRTTNFLKKRKRNLSEKNKEKSLKNIEKSKILSKRKTFNTHEMKMKNKQIQIIDQLRTIPLFQWCRCGYRHPIPLIDDRIEDQCILSFPFSLCVGDWCTHLFFVSGFCGYALVVFVNREWKAGRQLMIYIIIVYVYIYICVCVCGVNSINSNVWFII